MAKIQTRQQKLTGQLRLKGSGLEIGALCWPVLDNQKYDIRYVDHETTQEIARIYKDDPGVPRDRMVDVDYPLKGRSLRETVKGTQFDYIIASHVIEHVPDTVAWLQDMASVLKPGGMLSLAIPDKRYTFDIDRQVSTPADIVGAHFDTLTKPSATMIFDYASNFRLKVDAASIWGGELYLDSRAPHKHSPIGALELCRENLTSYIDTHCHVFTPASFFDIVRTLIELDMFEFEVVDYHDTAAGAYEFFATLRKVAAGASIAQKLASLPPVPPYRKRRQLEADLQHQATDITNLTQQLEIAQQELAQIRASKSWQMTRPVRAAVRGAKRIKRS